jgi:hypothetical protein
VRLRLVDAAAELKPIPNLHDLTQRVRQVNEELESIRDELLLFLHVQHLKGSGLDERLETLKRQIASGDLPKGRAVEDIVADVRKRMG